MAPSLNKSRLDDRLIELSELLRAVDRGWVAITEITNGFLWPCFVLSTGHKVVVFNDAGEWDYIECIYCPDGVWIDLWGINFDEIDIDDIETSEDTEKREKLIKLETKLDIVGKFIYLLF